MSAEPVIRVEGLSKAYRIVPGKVSTPAGLRESLSVAGNELWKRMTRGTNGERQKEVEFWALRDVSFDVAQGEIVGIIGRNGAGKSTLLKILSRITEPTSGRAVLEGRVASLLEVGTGFHGDLTGRENIFLNGAILGMRRAEILKKFDEIVAFSEVEQFIDTPVKRYSSGMYMRLAFAVAAHLEPEILAVDEVLAVGDAAFQKKCLGKMSDVSRAGRTVLFVSHNLAAVTGLCSRAILLSEGRLAKDGAIAGVVEEYVSLGRHDAAEVEWKSAEEMPGNDRIRMRSVRVRQTASEDGLIQIDEPIDVEICYRILVDGLRVTTSIHLLDHVGSVVLASANFRSGTPAPDPGWGHPVRAGDFVARCRIAANFLNEGTYRLNVIILTDVTKIEAFAKEVVSFATHDGGTMRKEYYGGWLGVVRPKLEWRTGQQMIQAGDQDLRDLGAAGR
jgi:lipopolysaccharide transport system ATP-binding protein